MEAASNAQIRHGLSVVPNNDGQVSGAGTTEAVEQRKCVTVFPCICSTMLSSITAAL